MEKPVIAVLGPTGTGKSDLSIALARELGGEIVNADALQFYRGMDIGTAKLPEAERGGIPHHLLDIMEVRQEASVARFQAEARACFAEIRNRGNVPILVGGSGLYVRAALDEIDFPPTDPAVRQRLEAEAAAGGIGPLATRLAAIDPESAARNLDDRRLIRALEVYEISGKPFSSFMPQRRYHAPAIQIGLNIDRALLHTRLQARVTAMVEQGLLEEVRRLDAQGLREGKTAGRAIGYAQFLAVLDGTMSQPEAVEKTVIATRQFARRQVTWFGADERVSWFDPTTDTLLRSVLARIKDT
ncbi:tRNA (adenosine(37)-N6)-dimethylallyltransferase MiaA [Paeniglutamicibacter gangotriensis]|uniref:tRNA dimethylallyltransferase n=2 Tax=Paeniglutamicibacter gangotriensis TaxID=254787 RepID=M7MMA5_9MICC|nr:tRNA (adenosine(37)-N6)-dimethylallyltransferase MiaA [Paeniglutamicibacter gangotriensis]EMQ97467.1 tRNA delta(2)-isopentenylpyrophosphate transferase [Paeniglutamicibacter gangotriensis Lz1y]KAA0974405.1 tRNA (adenosine(37)-N6)-dimethylallyltransferase MiaA [Paeniglutamicibacter gangotriensis]